MNIVISIENATPNAATLSAADLHSATWLYGQTLAAGQGVAANGGKIAGMLDQVNLPFNGLIRVHFANSAAGPVDVDFTFDGQAIDGTPLIGGGASRVPNGAFPNTGVDVHRDGDDYYLMLKIAP